MRRNIELERNLLRTSDIFDEDFYRECVGEEGQFDPFEHYLRVGWLNALEPSAEFPGSLFRPYFEAVGLEGPPAIHWLVLRSAGWAVPRNRAELADAVAHIRSTELFDEPAYAERLHLQASGLDPAIHYVLVGERTGYAPSERFDPRYYYHVYPDIARAGVSALRHFIWNGRSEGRNPLPFSSPKIEGSVQCDDRPNLLMVMHDSSRSGAPILGWNISRHLSRLYNLYTIALGGGPLMRDFADLSVSVHGPFPMQVRTYDEMEYSLRELLDERRYEYAVVNSIEARFVIQACARRFIPTVLLMHEFASYCYPPWSMKAGLDWATHIVFPARVVAQSAESVHTPILNQSVHILPQGISAVPGSEDKHDENFEPSLKKVSKKKENGAFVVVGGGTVQIRKGVDLFLAIAASLLRRKPQREFHFVWVGQGYRPQEDMNYSAYLLEQVQRSGLEEYVSFVGEAPSLDPVYAVSDAFLLSSRLDPLPNVAIDAMVHGLPIVCFADASGTAEMLLQDDETAHSVVPYLDIDTAAGVILKLANDQEFLSRVSAATRQLAQKTFDMKTYVDRVDRLGRSSFGLMNQRRADAETIAADPTFDQDMFLGPAPVVESRWNSIMRYLIARAAMGLPDQPVKDHPRRPSPGFHPQVYSEERGLDGNIDPFADFIRNGKPKGRWQTRVIRPENPEEQLEPRGQLRVALHAHAYYPEFLPALVATIRANRSACDLLISTDDLVKAQEIRSATNSYQNGRVLVRAMPNRGRDLGPFLTGFQAELPSYDVVGHVHSKRSDKVFYWDTEIGDNWREFMWQRLIGGRGRMMDRIIAEFEDESEVGLIFPSDSHLVGWDRNRKQGESLAARVGWQGKLPDTFDFPIGTMFWIRSQALQPLLNLNLDWEDYPEEPLPYDGTLLHALERMMPFSAQVAGYTSAVTHLSAVNW